MSTSTQTRWMSIGGGKGGVGKSLIAANLGVAMARMGRSVVLVDADLGAANLHTLFGLSDRGPTLRAFLEGRISHLEEAAVPTTIKGLYVIAGTGARSGAADPTPGERNLLLEGIRSLSADVALVDCGSGSSALVVDLFNCADLRLIALTPQLTSIHNAYGFLRTAVYRAIRRTAESRAELALLNEAAASPEAARVGDWLARVWQETPTFASRVVRTLENFGARIVGNQLLDDREAGSFRAVSRMFRDLLCVTAPVLGAINATRALHDSVDRRVPFMVDNGGIAASRVFTEVAAALVAEDVAALRRGRPIPQARVEAEAETPPIETSLPAGAFTRFVRRHERQPVDWHASYESGGGQQEVRIIEISLGGALVQTPAPVRVGDQARLVFDEFADLPSLPVEVRHVRAEEGMAGVRFLEEGDIPSALVRYAQSDATEAERQSA